MVSCAITMLIRSARHSPYPAAVTGGSAPSLSLTVPPEERSHRAVGVGVYESSTSANMSGATIDALLSMMYFGVSTPSLPHVIFSFGTAPEYDP